MSTNQESPTSEATLKSATFQNIGTVNIYDANFSMTSHHDAVERRDWDAGQRSQNTHTSNQGTQASPAKMHEAGPNVTSTSTCRKSYTRPSTQERNKSGLPTSADSAAGSSRSQDLTLTPTTREDQRPYKVQANNRGRGASSPLARNSSMNKATTTTPKRYDPGPSLPGQSQAGPSRSLEVTPMSDRNTQRGTRTAPLPRPIAQDQFSAGGASKPVNESEVQAPLTMGKEIVHSLTEDNVEISVRADDHDIYYHQLLVKRRGSPMWIPGPDMNLPTEYRRQGMLIGDVGILYRAEGFIFLFNIFLPANHPINKGRVPDNFEPLDSSRLQQGTKKQVIGKNEYLTSLSVRKLSSTDSHSSGLIFETSATEGAILIMPDGGVIEDLVAHKIIKEHLAKNAELWYTFVSDVLGLEVDNGDIRLVIGFDKLSSWGIATFSSTVGESDLLEFKSCDEDGQAVSQAYSWNCVGSGKGRVGPHETLQDLKREPDGSPLHNQCVFVRTLNFRLSGEIWENSTIHQIRQADGSPPSNGPPPDFSGRRSGSGAGNRGPSTGMLGPGPSHSNYYGNTQYRSVQFGLAITHPSNAINELLLDMYPNAQIAITEDADWLSTIAEDEVKFPDRDELCARVLNKCDIFEENGIVTFREMKGPPVQEALELSESEEEDLEVGDLDWENDDEAVKVAADNLNPEQPAQVMTQKTTSAKVFFTGEPTVSGDVPKTVKDTYSVNDIPAVVPRRTLRVIEGLLENYDTYVRTERFASLSAGVFFRCRAIYDAVTSQITQTTSSTANEVFLDENHYHAFIQLERILLSCYFQWPKQLQRQVPDDVVDVIEGLDFIQSFLRERKVFMSALDDLDREEFKDINVDIGPDYEMYRQQDDLATLNTLRTFYLNFQGTWNATVSVAKRNRDEIEFAISKIFPILDGTLASAAFAEMIIKTLMLVAIPYTFLDDCRRIALPLGYAIELRSRDFEFQEIVKSLVGEIVKAQGSDTSMGDALSKMQHKYQALQELLLNLLSPTSWDVLDLISLSTNLCHPFHACSVIIVRMLWFLDHSNNWDGKSELKSAMQKAILALNELQTEVIFFSAGTMYATPSSTIQALQHRMTSDFVLSNTLERCESELGRAMKTNTEYLNNMRKDLAFLFV